MHKAPPDGFRWSGRTEHEIVLNDPEVCPAGHPAQLVRRGFERCTDWAHSGHNSWTCACGQDIYRADGAYVGQLDCLTPHDAPPAPGSSPAPR